jgi:hypothetical protein
LGQGYHGFDEVMNLGQVVSKATCHISLSVIKWYIRFEVDIAVKAVVGKEQ